MESFIIDETSESFEFEKNELIESEDYDSSDIFYQIDGSLCQTQETFFNTFSRALNFPDHFSDNWDSFNDCFQDSLLESGKNVLLYIDQMDELLSGDKKGLYFFYDMLYSLKFDASETPFITILLKFG